MVDKHYESKYTIIRLINSERKKSFKEIMGKTNKNKKNPFKKVRLTWGEFDPNEKIHEKQTKKKANKKQELKKLIDFEDDEEYDYSY